MHAAPAAIEDAPAAIDQSTVPPSSPPHAPPPSPPPPSPPDVEDVALVAQADARLFHTMAAHAAEADVVCGQETHLLRGQDRRAAQLRGLLTTGRFEGWKLLLSNAEADDAYAGLFIWYNAGTVETRRRRISRSSRRDPRRSLPCFVRHRRKTV